MTEYDVIEDADAHEVANIAEPLRKREVLGGRRGIAAGVVVDQNCSGGAAENQRLHDLSRVDERSRERTDRDG